MINNRQGSRRRGRGGQQPRGMSGNNSGNRQDNRQRGNAAQLHEKYKSMARDAQLGGDRVQTEYYLQFADHYFRMLGDARPRFDDQNRQRDDDQDDDGDDRMDSDLDHDGDGEIDGDPGDQPQRQPQQGRTRPTGDRAEPRRDRPNNDRGNSDRSEPRRERANSGPAGGGNRNRDDDRGGRDASDAQRIDYAVLPPAIASDDHDREPVRSDADEVEEAPKPRRRVRRPRVEEGDATAS